MPGTDRSLAVVSAHVADFCIRAGGTIARYSRAGWRVCVLCLTFGERGESAKCWEAGMQEPQVKAIRRSEGEAAAAVLGAEIAFVDWGDQPLVVTRDRTAQLVGWLRQVRPRAVLTHFPCDPWNPDHEVAARGTQEACYFASLLGVPGGEPIPVPSLYQFEPTWPFAPTSGFVPNVYVDITDVIEVKREAMGKLASQPEMVDRYTQVAAWRAAEARKGKPGSLAYAEAFHWPQPHVGLWLPSQDI